MSSFNINLLNYNYHLALIHLKQYEFNLICYIKILPPTSKTNHHVPNPALIVDNYVCFCLKSRQKYPIVTSFRRIMTSFCGQRAWKTFDLDSANYHLSHDGSQARFYQYLEIWPFDPWPLMLLCDVIMRLHNWKQLLFDIHQPYLFN